MVGFMAALTRCSMSEGFRQRARRGIGRERVAPWKKVLGQGDQRLDQNGDQKLALQPRLGALRINLFEMTERKQRFEALEGQFHLPSAAIDFEDGGRRDVRIKGGEHEDILGRLQRIGLDLVATPAGGAAAPSVAACTWWPPRGESRSALARARSATVLLFLIAHTRPAMGCDPFL